MWTLFLSDNSGIWSYCAVFLRFRWQNCRCWQADCEFSWYIHLLLRLPAPQLWNDEIWGLSWSWQLIYFFRRCLCWTSSLCWSYVGVFQQPCFGRRSSKTHSEPSFSSFLTVGFFLVLRYAFPWKWMFCLSRYWLWEIVLWRWFVGC